MGRFINADTFASTGQGILGNNPFIYALNNPMTYTDHEGTVALCAVFYVVGKWALGRIVEGVVGGLVGAGVNSICDFAMTGKFSWNAAAEGFVDGFLGGVFGKGYILYETWSTYKECTANKATVGGSLLAAGVTLCAGLAFDSVDCNSELAETVLSCSVGTGMSLISTAVEKSVTTTNTSNSVGKSSNSTNKQSKPITQKQTKSSRGNATSGGSCGSGGRSASILCVSMFN